ncbi:hypothetical protein NCS57_00172600 [Fusarium keratoplasticum]|uniref:Uncharacterized protein n=1 Tax=Fusarium keratoplasticum TaxID=1328300 RepID=A0ACC0RFX3_9HYPO|nr:hypothetical protein NCS57_00172600 [Fusarium keratoplasticum]KAI8685046.1 hypothetical protein NCS57_00172600 [Fusarium keratoplasticum]
MSDEEFQDDKWYPGFSAVISGPLRQLPQNLKTLILFEDFNPVFFPDAPASTRIPNASFMVDAQDFFNADQAYLDPEDKDLGLTNLLEEAGRFALGTPRLRTMILWYGNKNKAYAFIYKRDETSITWHGTREFDMNQQRITEI